MRFKLIVALVFSATCAIAQPIEGLKLQRLKISCLQALEDFNEKARLKKPEDWFAFTAALDSTATLPNQVLAANQVDTLVSAQQYRSAMLIYRYRSSFRIRYFKPYSLQSYYADSLNKQKVIFKIKAHKLIEHRAKENEVVYSDTLNLLYTLSYSALSQKFKLQGIRLLEPVGRYWLIEIKPAALLENPQLEDSLLVNNQVVALSYRNFLVIKVKDDAKDYKIEPYNRDYLGTLKKQVRLSSLEGYGKYQGQTTSLKLRPKKYWVAPNFTYGAFADDFAVRTNNRADRAQGRVRQLAYGVDLGLDFLRSKPWYLSLYVGVGLANYSANYTLNQYSNSSKDYFDRADTTYDRTVRLNDINEQVQWQGLYYHGGLSLRYQFTRVLGAQLGLSYGQFASQTASYNFSAQANYIAKIGADIYLREKDLALEGGNLQESNDLQALSQQTLAANAGVFINLNRRWQCFTNVNLMQTTAQLPSLTKNQLSANNNEASSLLNFRNNTVTWRYFAFNLGLKYWL